MMARYYDMDKLKAMTEAKADTLIEGKEAFLYVAKWLDLLPSADVVEVVRCKDCAHKGSAFCMSGDFPLTKENENCYCSYGARTPKERS